MCYSARVEQNAKKLERMLKAEIDVKQYDQLFSRRLAGEKKLYINKGMEETFLKDPKSKDEKSIAKKIEEWHETEVTRLQQELFKQTKRLADAERKLKDKPTKKAQEDLRISGNKIEKIKQDLKRHENLEKVGDTDHRIFPLHYASVVALNDDGEKIVMPMRYLMRPHDKDESFDLEYGGCYNARFDNLTRVGFWKDSLENRRGVMLITKFYENVPTKRYLENFKLDKASKEKENIVICFEPDNVEYMYVPIIWDRWEKKGSPPLYSCAIVTDDPLPEIARAGHDRTPIFLKPSAVDAWLSATGSAKEIKEMLNDRELPHYSHEVQGVA